MLIRHTVVTDMAGTIMRSQNTQHDYKNTGVLPLTAESCCLVKSLSASKDSTFADKAASCFTISSSFPCNSCFSCSTRSRSSSWFLSASCNQKCLFVHPCYISLEQYCYHVNYYQMIRFITVYRP